MINMVDFSNLLTFLIWYVITVAFLAPAFLYKKSALALVPVVYFTVILGITTQHENLLQDPFVHRNFALLGLGISLCLFLVINDIEIRRKVIMQVFKNRYQDRQPQLFQKLTKKGEEKIDESSSTKS